jgi:hypothetical protein
MDAFDGFGGDRVDGEFRPMGALVVIAEPPVEE